VKKASEIFESRFDLNIVEAERNSFSGIIWSFGVAERSLETDRVANLVQRLIELPAGQMPLRRRHVTEADVGALRLGEQAPAVARPHEIDEVTRQREHAIDVGLETARTLRLPHVPEFNDVGATAALHVPVSAVERRIVELVVLKEVTRARAMRRLQQT